MSQVHGNACGQLKREKPQSKHQSTAMATNGPRRTVFYRMNQSSAPPRAGKVTHCMFYGVKEEQLLDAQDVPNSTVDHVMQIHSYFSIFRVRGSDIYMTVT
jgi:hypothetical protein